MDWPEIKPAILDRLDLKNEFEILGVRFPDGARDSNGSGRIRCHAMGREDRKPSAVVNIITGFYQDYGGDGDAMSFWDFAAKYGGHKDWRASIGHYAKQVGLDRRLPKDRKAAKDPAEHLSFAIWNPLGCRGLCKLYGISHGTLSLVGARFASYPKKSPNPQYVAAVPCYGPMLTAAPPTGFACQPANGTKLELWQGEGNQPAQQTRITQGRSGMMGRHGLKQVVSNPQDVKRVYKVEGFSDMLKLQDMIPTERRDEILVISNASGASEIRLIPEVAGAFHGVEVCVLHDADVPGQSGAKAWCGGLLKAGASVVRNVQLPYEIEEKSGKDFRDWVAEGHDFLDLQRLADATQPISADTESPHDPQTLSPTDTILNTLGIIVLGHRERVITCFSRKHGRSFEINGISRYKLQEFIVDVGGEHLEFINHSNDQDAPGKFTFGQITTAIADAASRERLTDSNQRGVGIWDLNGRLCIVNGGEAAIINGSIEKTQIPKAEGVLLAFGESESEKWYEYDWLEDRLRSATPEWRKSIFEDLVRLFGLWDNWRHKDTPQLVASLVLCTWLQTIWPWRPQCAIAGPTNSGKTILMEFVLQPLFQNAKMSLYTMKATEAAIRQHVKHTGRVILIDEFESDSNRQKILELFRTSSRGGKIIRGTATQQGVSYGLRHIPWVGAIETGMRDAADRNRYIMLDLLKPSRNKKEVIHHPSDLELQELGLNAMVAAVSVWKEALAINNELRRYPISGLDTRITESFSVPSAMMGAVLGLDAKQSRGLLEQFVGCRNFEVQQESDEEELLRTIYDSEIRLDHGKMATIGELIEGEHEFGVGWMKALGRNGIGVNGSTVFFSPKKVQRSLLQKTKYEYSQIGQILERIDGAKSGVRFQMPGHRPRGISVPKSTLLDILEGKTSEQSLEDEGEDLDF